MRKNSLRWRWLIPFAAAVLFCLIVSAILPARATDKEIYIPDTYDELKAYYLELVEVAIELKGIIVDLEAQLAEKDELLQESESDLSAALNQIDLLVTTMDKLIKAKDKRYSLFGGLYAQPTFDMEGIKIGFPGIFGGIKYEF